MALPENVSFDPGYDGCVDACAGNPEEICGRSQKGVLELDGCHLLESSHREPRSFGSFLAQIRREPLSTKVVKDRT